MPNVYLIHFSEPFQHAKHYLGFTKRDDVQARFEEHAAGRGATLTRVAVAAGITFELARVWKGESRTFERSLKNRKNTPRLCPICKEKKCQS